MEKLRQRLLGKMVDRLYTIARDAHWQHRPHDTVPLPPPVLNAWGRSTGVGVSRVLPVVSEAVSSAGQHFLRIADLQRELGRMVAGHFAAGAAATGTTDATDDTDARATHCSASGVSLAVAACIQHMAVKRGYADIPLSRFPLSSQGEAGAEQPPRAVLVQAPHCVSYGQPIEQAIRISGAHMVVAGDPAARSCSLHDVEELLAAGDIAAVLYVHSSLAFSQAPLMHCGGADADAADAADAAGAAEAATDGAATDGAAATGATTTVDMRFEFANFAYGLGRGAKRVQQVGLAPLVGCAHKHGVPVIVDAAACDPLLDSIVATGADVCVFSVQKYLRGLTCGLVVGRSGLVRLLDTHHNGFGRAMKPTREGITGAMAALAHAWSPSAPSASSSSSHRSAVRHMERARAFARDLTTRAPFLDARVVPLATVAHGVGVASSDQRVASESARCGAHPHVLVWLATERLPGPLRQQEWERLGLGDLAHHVADMLGQLQPRNVIVCPHSLAAGVIQLEILDETTDAECEYLITALVHCFLALAPQDITEQLCSVRSMTELWSATARLHSKL